MSNVSQTYILSSELRDSVVEQISSFQKQNVLLQQSLREQQTQSEASLEDLFLEILEVGDALLSLMTYLENNPNPSPEFIQRLPKSVATVHRKFLSVLRKRQVIPIEIEDTQPDFNLCRVVDREVRTDVADQTITKIVRQGFRLGDKVLRPTEVITSQSD